MTDKEVEVFLEAKEKLSKIDKNEQIRNFIKKRNVEIIEFKGQDVIDYGGILEIDT